MGMYWSVVGAVCGELGGEGLLVGGGGEAKTSPVST